MALAIGVDVGGTKVAAGVVDDDGTIVAETKLPTSGDPVDAIVSVVGELRTSYPDVVAVGVGAAGQVSDGVVLFAPHLPWREFPLRDRVAAAVGLPVVVDNDANAAAWAEHRFGAGQGERALVCVTVGTGIGGGIVLDGALFRGRWGIAGEMGHILIVVDGEPCPCGSAGCLEQYASGSALARLAGGDGEGVTERAKAGDPDAVAMLAEVGGWLGIGLANMAAMLDPGRFVVGGGVADAGELLLGPARASYVAHLTGSSYRPHADIRLAALGNKAGLVGAADLARAT